MTPLIQEPMAVFGYLAAVFAAIFWVSEMPALQKVFRITPAVIYCYFVPTLSTTVGIIPMASPVYEWMTRYLLPVALLLLMITVDLKSILKLGRTALIMVTAGSIGIMIGAQIAFLVFSRWLPPEGWKGLAALTGSWIGGTANMVAIAESVGTPDAIMGPIIVVDTVVGYGWMGVLLFLSAWQVVFDKRLRADTSALAETNKLLADLDTHRRPAGLRDIAIILGLGFAGAILAVQLGEALPALGNPTIISHTTWAVLLVVTGGLALSFTPVRNLEEAGASKLGYAALYLLLTAIGAQGNLLEVLSAPAFFFAGVLVITIHVAVMLAVAKIIKAPFFFVATGSVANIGGAGTAPIVASVYHPAMAPVGLLMAVAGYILGIYGALGAAWMLGALAG
ncbi:MAG: DUF819 family protein [Gemmatimonadetes bacterium]|nr:DUF819 family protein [Gemmatimonadota bacterium]MBT8479626.1 DUF819 family protein [Gemmatimonadota bacterium]NNK47586.1 DUF819 family protein [Gemmatimonadota bacterium]